MLQRRKQYGGQDYNQYNSTYTDISGQVNPIQELQGRIDSIKKNINSKRILLQELSTNFNTSEDKLRNLTAEKARLNENLAIKIKAESNLQTSINTELRPKLAEATQLKNSANSEYNLSVNKKKNFEEKLSKAEEDLTTTSTQASVAKTQADAAQTEVAKSQSLVTSLAKEITDMEQIVKVQTGVYASLEISEAKQYDPTILKDVRAWFDASKLEAANGATITSWPTATSALIIPNAPSFSGQATIRLLNAMKVVSLSPSQSLSLTSSLQLEQFTLFLVCRHSGTNQNAILQGSSASNTVYGFTTGKKNYFSIGTVNNTNSAINADTNWNIMSFSRNADKTASFFSNGVKIIEYTNTTSGFDGLSVNTGTQKSDAEIAEIVLFSKSLVIDDIQKIEGLLARKWGLVDSLNSGQPYKLKFPDLLGVTGGARKKRRMKRKTKKVQKVRKAKKRYTRRR
jgi:hypothetical protein